MTFIRQEVGAPQSASLDAGGNLWLLDGPRLGVLRTGAAGPTWSEGPGRLGRGALGAMVCGGAAGSAQVHYAAAAPGEVERFVLEERDAARPAGPVRRPADCQRGCEPEDARGLPGEARPTRCARDDDGSLWVGTLSHGLWRQDGSGFHRIGDVTGRWVRELSIAASRVVVVVTERGVFTAPLPPATPAIPAS